MIFKNTTFNNDNNINSLLWDFGDGTTSTIENPRHLFPSVGTYNVTFSFSNSLGCQYTKTETIVISPTPEPHLIGGIICLDPKGVPVNDFILDSETSNVDYEYKWFLNGKLINGASKSTYVPLEKGNYSVLVTDSTSGCFNQAFAKVESSQMASDFVPKVSDAFATDNIVNIEVIGGTGPFLFQLDDNPFQESNSYSRLSSGEHTLVVKDSLNCTFISKQVTIMTFPMFFTPNNDGINDYWNIPNYKNFFEAQIAIFDRFGKLIKEISPLSLGWDGYHNGDLMPATDYWFTLNYKEMEQNGNLTSKSFKSHFTLKR